MFTHQSSPRAYDATWEAKSTWLPEINRCVVRRKHLCAFHLLSRTRTSRSVAASSANHGTRDVASWWISQDVPDLRKELHDMYSRSRKRGLPLSLGSILLGHKRIGFGWTFLSVHRGHPAKRSICENDTSWELSFAWTLEMERTSKCLDSLFHWSPVVVDLIQDINDSSTQKYCWIVKVVHEAGKLI